MMFIIYIVAIEAVLIPSTTAGLLPSYLRTFAPSARAASSCYLLRSPGCVPACKRLAAPGTAIAAVVDCAHGILAHLRPLGLKVPSRPFGSPILSIRYGGSEKPRILL